MNIHFSELMLVIVVALLVIKPQQLPGLALRLGKLIAWARQSFANFKHDMNTHE